MTARARKLIAVELDDASVVRRSPEVEHERRVAIYDILEDNDFALVEGGNRWSLAPAHIRETGRKKAVLRTSG